ncbi:diguanylate cyclase [Aquabacterium sp.]|uniref:GGDEF domain-containing protein n=1 Tax=Aquabacterium sp. TaxID=1872578 RepID=UPI0035B055B3
MSWRLPQWMRLGATARIAMGLVSLTLVLVLVLDLIFKLMPDPRTQMQAARERTAIDLAVQTKSVLAHPDAVPLLEPMLGEIQSHASDIASVGVRRADGALMASTRGHQQSWRAPAGGLSTLTAVVVPLYNGSGESWGSMEVQFTDPVPRTLLDWLRQPASILILALSSAGFMVFYFYLRRVLQHLDPSKAIPDRVRAAFDTLTEGLLVLDPRGHILLVNNSFRGMHPLAQQSLLGRRIEQLDWLMRGFKERHATPPWVQAMAQSEPILGTRLELTVADGEPRHVLMNCAAIRDAGGNPRGCLLTLDDITELDRVNLQLRKAMGELEASRDQIQRQNDELQLLANCDPMTGCFNRRAFFARAEELYAQARQTQEPLCCLMTDIDKFKSFNDTYGHSVGDLVIQQVARILRSSMRPQDVLCRYGGEEFCALLPGMTQEQALEFAERIRSRIETEAGPGVDAVEGLCITSSFGVSQLGLGDAHNIAQLIERADQGLYAAKEGGRNQVQCLDARFAETVLAEEA